MERFIYHNQVLCTLLLFYFFCYSGFQVNYLSSFSSSSPNTGTNYLCPPKQSLALLQFKSTIEIHSGSDCSDSSSLKMDSWKEDSECCSWDGVTCNEITGNVIGLDLHCWGLRGKIEDNSSLFHLTHLQWINLAYNDFYGSKISPEFGQLTELTQLNLSYANFDGLVPSEISLLSKLNLLDLSTDFHSYFLSMDQKFFDLLALNLTRLSVLELSSIDMSLVKPYSLLNLSLSMMVLNLSLTRIQGKLPEEIFSLPNLQEVDLSDNFDLIGHLPKSNWSSHLRVLELSYTNFTGDIPNSIGNLKFLEILSIPGCRFIGSIPISIGNLARLTKLDLSTNKLTGHIPQIFHLSNLQEVYLSINFNLRGYLPKSNWSSHLRVLDLSDINFAGDIPNSIGNLKFLEILYIARCNFIGSIPISIGNLTRLTKLDLANNKLVGHIPKIFCLPNLQEVDLSKNDNLTGYLPKSNWSSHLRVLYLSETNFTGDIPNSIGNLKFLEILYLRWCNFIGSIPISIGNLTRLTDLDMSANGLIGELPSLSSLQKVISYINLSGNNLTGQIPGIFDNFSLSPSHSPQLSYHGNILSHLTSIELSHNFLHGKVPSWLFTRPSLYFVDLGSNNLIGPIEEFNLSLATSIKDIYLQDNEIHGSIPNSIFELVNLIDLDISSNNLSGTIKFDMLSKLKNLEALILSNNNLLSFSPTSSINYSMPNLQYLSFSFCNVSEFPMFLRTFEKLKSLELSNNRISGQILKTESEGWKNLTSLYLSNNFLTYIEHHPWKNIQILDLQNNTIQGSVLVPPLSTQVFLFSNNKLSGEIPPSICTLSSLQYLSLSENNLSGIIPPCLGNLSTGLVMLHLQKNNLEGGIPDTLTNGSQLRSLDLSSNNLEGLLPRSLANYSQLEVFNVGNNMINDTFPCWLGTLSKLKVILRSNRFYGTICDFKTISPFSNLQILDLSHNKFNGFLPRRFFAYMEKMMDANTDESEGLQYMGGKYYYDSVVVTMKGKEYALERIFTIFASIDLSKNQFQGEIPDVLAKFQSLKVLNLSHNSLTDNIPMSFANLANLESLDLSFNKLDGKIPNQLRSITTLSALNLSYNQLSGHIPQGNQFNTFENDSFIGNKGLCGKPLSLQCNNEPPPSLVLNEENEIASEFDWKFAMMGYAFGVVIGMSIGYTVFSTRKPQWLVRIVEE